MVFRPMAAALFAAYFAWKLVEASLIVAWEVITPRNRINEAIVAVPLRVDRPIIVTMIANSVSLTPGTLTLEARLSPPMLYIHVLHLKSVEDVRSDVRRLEELAVRALVADTDVAVDVAVTEPIPGSDHRSRDGGDPP
jgi:multicomponent Na+:H+ antiporter subunit E